MSPLPSEVIRRARRLAARIAVAERWELDVQLIGGDLAKCQERLRHLVHDCGQSSDESMQQVLHEVAAGRWQEEGA